VVDDIVGAIAIGRRRRGRARDIIGGGFHFVDGSLREVVGGIGGRGDVAVAVTAAAASAYR